MTPLRWVSLLPSDHIPASLDEDKLFSTATAGIEEVKRFGGNVMYVSVKGSNVLARRLDHLIALACHRLRAGKLMQVAKYIKFEGALRSRLDLAESTTRGEGAAHSLATSGGVGFLSREDLRAARPWDLHKAHATSFWRARTGESARYLAILQGPRAQHKKR